MFNAGFKRKYAGLTWVEVLVTLAILGVLLVAGISHWRGLQIQQAERRLLSDVGRVLAFARNQAFLQGETLVLLPRFSADNWSSGMILQQGSTQQHAWHWHHPGVRLTWHGFLGNDKLVVAHSPAKLAMNGYFLLETGRSHSTRWVVNRFGRIRALRKHVD